MRLNGNLTLQTVPTFLKAVREETSPVLILDFSDVAMVDSAGVGALIQTHVGMARLQRRLGMAGMNQRIQSVLEVTRVRNLFPLYADVAEAESQLS